MTSIAAASPSTAATRSLPPLSGRLLHAYRAIWAALALGSVATMASLVLSAGMDAGILALRIGKGAVLVAVSTILFRRRQSDIVAALLSSAFLLWTITSSFNVTGGHAPVLAEVADRLRFLLFALALLLFPGGNWFPSWTRAVGAASGGVFVLGVAEALGWLHSRLYLPLAVLCVLLSIGALVDRLRLPASEVESQQSKWIAFGLVSGISLILAARGGAALDLPIEPLLLEALFQSGIVAIAVGFLVSLLRYRLYDAESVISRSAAYAILTLCLVATFAGSEALIEMLGQQYFGSGIGSISGAMAAAVAAVLLSPLHGRVTAWAERYFQRDLAELKEKLPELLAELSGTSSPSRIGRAALPRISQAIQAGQAALVVDGSVIATIGAEQDAVSRWAMLWLPEDWTDDFAHDGRSEFPLRMPLRCPFGSLRGWLLIGPRPDASRYSRDDLEALGAINRPLRATLFAAREREIERQREAAMQRATQQAIASLRHRLEGLEARTARSSC